jgi:nucleotide-binding universal stress UspA family protein
MKKAEPTFDDVDWSLTTFEGARREQLRRWAKLPLEDVIRSLEEMDELAQLLQHSRETGPARAYAQAWVKRAEMLDAERLRDLRALSELDGARRFANLLQAGVPAASRPNSGLVEQQRIFARLRRTPA